MAGDGRRDGWLDGDAIPTPRCGVVARWNGGTVFDTQVKPTGINLWV